MHELVVLDYIVVVSVKLHAYVDIISPLNFLSSVISSSCISFMNI
jgi:hypothetical protein